MPEIISEKILADLARLSLEMRGGFADLRTEVKQEISKVRSEMGQINTCLDRMEKDIRIIRDQTAHLTEAFSDVYSRITRLESKSPVGKA